MIIESYIKPIAKLVKKNYLNPLFYVWIYLTICSFKFFTLAVIFLTVIQNIYLLFYFMQNESKEVRIKVPLKFSQIHSILQINSFWIFSNIRKKTSKFDILIIIVIRYAFTTLVGIGYKVIKFNLVFFDNLITEFYHSKIHEKKIKINILKKYFRNVVMQSIADEFFVPLYLIPLKIELEFLGYKKSLYIEFIRE
jgi:hypothetical protein